MKGHLGECINPTVEGRSVMITCAERETTVTVTSAHYHPETTTLMLYPYYPSSDCHHCEDDRKDGD